MKALITDSLQTGSGLDTGSALTANNPSTFFSRDGG
jgi:hypothetical protein